MHLSLGVDIIGFGPIGRELARRLGSEELKKSFNIASITDSSGTVYPKNPADVLKAVGWKEGKPDQKLNSSGIEKHGGKSSDSQIVVDVTTSDYNKADEAKGRTTDSLGSGKHFVT